MTLGRKFAAVLWGTASTVAFVSTSAIAQEGPEPQGQTGTSEAPQAEGGLGDIVVTAQRRAQRLQDVPLAVSAISGDDLVRRSVLQVTDLSRAVPGVNISAGGFGGGAPRFNIRSQVQFEQLLTLDASVAVYFADVVQARAHGTNAGFFDLESVQVLKGPQGTLYGRNTTGGAVLITPRAASTDAIAGYVRASLGNYDAFVAEGAVNVPITQRLAVRLAGRMAYHDGYTYSPAARAAFDNEDNQSWRASIHWEPFDGITNDTVVNGYHADEMPTAFRLTDVLPGSSFAIRAPETLAFLASVGDRRIAGNGNPLARTTTRTVGVANTTVVDLGAFTIKNIFGYRRVRNSNALDFDGTPFRIYDAPESLRSSQYSDELQVSGKAFDKRLNWIAGGYWFRETGDETQSSFISVVPQSITRTGTVRNTSKSIFAQGSYDIGTARAVTLTAGGRYTWDTRQFQQFGGYNLLSGTCLSALTALPRCDSPQFSKKFGAFTYTVSADWRFAQDKMLYLAHRKGYRSGGYNLRATTAAQFRPFDPENVKDAEIGLKADWEIGGTTLRTNIAVYYQWYSDIQRNVAFIDPQSQTLAISVVNAAKAHVFGFEAEGRWIPVPGLEISGNVSHSRLRYDNFNQPLAGGGIQDLSKNRLSFAPEWQGGGSVRYTLPLHGDEEEVAVQGDVYTQSRMQLADLNVPRGVAAGYTLANFRLEWNHAVGSPISIAGFLRNAFDKNYYTGGLAITGLGPISKQYGAPRTYGVEVSVVFGG